MGIIELSAKDRAFKLLDDEVGRELAADVISPHLKLQGIEPEAGDGVCVVRGKIQGNEVVIFSIDGKFLGGAIGEVSGAKITATLEHILIDNKAGKKITPIFILDTGGVRLEEANYGLLAISEMHDLVVELKKYARVIGIIPGKIGSFGGMSITAALMSYLIGTEFARIGLNGPKVIETEAGVEEFDSKDKMIIKNTIGIEQRIKTGIMDEIVRDEIEEYRKSIISVIREEKDSQRDRCFEFFLTLLDNIDMKSDLSPLKYREIYNKTLPLKHHFKETIEGEISEFSRGRAWFEVLTGIKNAKSDISTVLYAKRDGKFFISVVKDGNNTDFPRVRNGELGLKEAFAIAMVINELIEDEKEIPVDKKTPIVMIVDVPSQAFGYKEELIGIHAAFANAISAYVRARRLGHKLIAFIAGDAVSGGALTHGFQSARIIALNDENIVVQAMSKKSLARVTHKTLEEVQNLSNIIPSMAYDIKSFYILGAVYKLIDIKSSDFKKPECVEEVKKIIEEAIENLNNEIDLSFRYNNEVANADKGGRKATLKIRENINKEWKSSN